MPVRLPPGCARFAAKPDPIGSETPRNTIGIVLVWRCNAAVTGVDTARMTSGCSATSSFASGSYRPASAAAKRCSMWTVRPSTQPKLASPSRNFANWLFLSLSSSAVSSNTPTRRMRSRCCARAANGQAAADPATPLMRSRRRIARPEAQDYAKTPDYANIFGHGYFWLDCRPCAEPFQRRFGIKPDRNCAYIACCYTAISGKFGKIKARSDCDVVNLGILGSDQYQLIAQQIDARVNFLLHAVVHPLQVSGGKYVRWRALLDLLSQRRTCSIAGDDFDAALLCESCINIIECVRKRGGGKHRDGFVFRMSGCCSNREEPHALPNDHSKRNDAQNCK